MMSDEVSVEATMPLVSLTVVVVVEAMIPGSEACCAFSESVATLSQGREKLGYCGGDCAKAGDIATARARVATLPRTRFFFSIFVSFGLGSRRNPAESLRAATAASHKGEKRRRSPQPQRSRRPTPPSLRSRLAFWDLASCARTLRFVKMNGGGAAMVAEI